MTYREFIPGVSIVLAKEFTSPAGEMVNTGNIHKATLENYYEKDLVGGLG